MLIPAGFISSSFSFSIGFLALACAAALPVLGTLCKCGHCDGGDEEDDSDDCDELSEAYADTENEIAVLAQNKSRTEEQSLELIGLYAKLATQKIESYEVDDAVSAYENAIGLLTAMPDINNNDIKARHLAELYVDVSRLLANLGDHDDALASLSKAKDALKDLVGRQDGDAMYEVAQIQYHRGCIYREVGDNGEAAKALDDAFIRYRALEKITDLSDTRYDMALVSLEQAFLMRETGQPIAKITDLYNRTMRLLVELIDIGQLEHELLLAETLIDKCSATFDAYLNDEVEFESEEKEKEEFDVVLKTVTQGLDIMRRLAQEKTNVEAQEAYLDSSQHYMEMLSQRGRDDEALKLCDEVINEFFGDGSDIPDGAGFQYAMLLNTRGDLLRRAGRYDEAIKALDTALGTVNTEISDLDLEVMSQFGDDMLAPMHVIAQLIEDKILTFSDKGDKAAANKCFEDAKTLIEPFRAIWQEQADEALKKIEEVLNEG
ncbi:MAG: tetratricopeptide repeat protein [Planctomycetaceae bacterium]|jgi:tetratricopeptide (TPR) repeat protein|nr:tetratricopeptide repeat protein [Planctomycetaceae bacterium]